MQKTRKNTFGCPGEGEKKGEKREKGGVRRERTAYKNTLYRGEGQKGKRKGEINIKRWKKKAETGKKTSCRQIIFKCGGKALILRWILKESII